MAKTTTKKKKPNPTDATLRNVRAAKKRHDDLANRVTLLEQKLEKRDDRGLDNLLRIEELERKLKTGD